MLASRVGRACLGARFLSQSHRTNRHSCRARRLCRHHYATSSGGAEPTGWLVWMERQGQWSRLCMVLLTLGAVEAHGGNGGQLALMLVALSVVVLSSM